MSDIVERPGVFALSIVLKLISHSALLTAILSLKLMSFVMLGYIKGLKPISFVALNLDISPSSSELLIFKISSNKCLTGALQY